MRIHCAARAHAPTTPLALAGAALFTASALASNPFANQPKADDVFYHIMPITWRDGPDSDAADPNRFGDLAGIREGLPYLDDLGVTAYWLNPIFPSPAYHGYQHGRGDQINPRFGTEQDFLDLVNASHALGIEVYLDFVVYGISHDSPWFQSAFGSPFSQYDDWLAFDNFNNTQFLGSTYPTWSGDTVGFIHWDLRNQQTADLVTSWALKWMDPNSDGDFADGIDGFRLDHVWVNYGSGPDGWGYNLDDFWADWHADLRALNPDVFTFAEQHNWGSHGAEYLPQFDAAMTKPFEFAARDALWNEHAGALYFQMEQTIATLPAGQGTYVAIIGDHDVDRLASSIGATSPATLGRLEAAAAVLMLQPFPPIIYAGDEIGMEGFKASYGSDADDIPMREPFKWNATEGAPMSRYHRLHGPAFANQYSSNNDGRSVQEQQSGGPLQAHKDLISLRHANVALRRGTYHPIDASDGAVWAFLRRYEQGEAPIADGTQAIAAAINLSGSTTVTTLDLSPYLPEGAVLPASLDAAGAQPIADISAANASNYQITIPPYGYATVFADLARPPAPPIAIDGLLDPEYVEVASSGGGSIYAALDGDVLYLATNPAGDGLDRFLVLAEQPGALRPAMWAKTGDVANWDAFIGNEADNGWSGWFEAADPFGPISGLYLEGAIDLAAQFGTLPERVSIAALSFFTADGEVLEPALQVPAGNGDLDVQASEFVEVVLSELAAGCPADLAEPSGDLDIFDVLAYLDLFDSSDPAADLAEPSGNLDIFDVLAYLALFDAGC